MKPITTVKQLADLIRSAQDKYTQGFNKMYLDWDAKTNDVQCCAMGAVYCEAVGLPALDAARRVSYSQADIDDYLDIHCKLGKVCQEAVWDTIDDYCKDCGLTEYNTRYGEYVRKIVFHLNDCEKLSFTEIADRLDNLSKLIGE